MHSTRRFATSRLAPWMLPLVVAACAARGDLDDQTPDAVDSESSGALTGGVPEGQSGGGTNDTAWSVRLDRTAAEFDADIAARKTATNWIRSISVVSIGGVPRYSTIWDTRPAGAWIVRRAQTTAELQSDSSSLSALGYRPVVIEGYDLGGAGRFATVWEKKAGDPWIGRVGLSPAQLDSEQRTHVARGFRIVRVEGYVVNGQQYFTALWERREGATSELRHGMTEAAFTDARLEADRRGLVPLHASSYNTAAGVRVAAVFHPTDGARMDFHQGLEPRALQHEIVDRSLRSFRPLAVSAHAAGGTPRYTAIWQATPGAADGVSCLNGQCLRLGRAADALEAALSGSVLKYGFEMRHGGDVVRRAGGLKRMPTDAPSSTFTVHDRFNPASVSKTATAVLTLQLLHRRGLSVDTRIGPYLPNNWNVPAVNQSITWKQVLNHSSGLRDATANGQLYSNVQTLMETPVNAADVGVDSYQNVNYALLRILVASLDGHNDWVTNPGDETAARFIRLINSQLFAPLGIYDVAYRPDAAAPTLFYPNPADSGPGRDFGDYSRKPGSAGMHTSVHELAVFADALYSGRLLPSSRLADLKNFELGFRSASPLADGSRCWDKGGYFPEDSYGAELRSDMFACENGLRVVLVVNGGGMLRDMIHAAVGSAFTPSP